MKCNACGEQLSGRAVLCTNCGAGPEGDSGSTASEWREMGEKQWADTGTGCAGGPANPSGTTREGGPPRTDGGVHIGGTGTTSRTAAAGGGQRGTGSAGGGPGGESGRTAGPAGGDGQGAGGGGIQSTISELPLLTGVIAGFLAGIVMVLVGVGVALAAPPGRFFGSTMDLATISVVDLHFGLGGHFIPRFVFARFEEFAPHSTLLGLLYLLPPLFLYTGGKAVSSWAPDAESAAEALLNGTTVVLGYLPVVFVVLLLLPGGAVRVRIATPLLLAGIVYPLLFGSLGGIAEHHFPADARRVGVGYGVALILLVAFFLFLLTFVLAGSLTIADRLVFTILLLGAVQTLSGVGTLAGAAVLAVPAVVAALAIGFLRSWRAHRRQTILEGLTRPLTAAWTYAVGIAIIVSAIPVFADSYAAAELKLGGLVSGAASDFASANLATIGDFVDLVFMGTVVFAVALGGISGLIAAVIRHRQGTRAEQRGAAPGGAAGGEQAGALAGGASGPSTGGGSTTPGAGEGTTGSAGSGGVGEAGTGGEATGPTAGDEPLGPSAGGGRTGPEPSADRTETDDRAEDSPGAEADRRSGPSGASGAPDGEEGDDTGDETAGIGDGTAGIEDETADIGDQKDEAGQPAGESDGSGGTREAGDADEDEEDDEGEGFDWGDEE